MAGRFRFCFQCVGFGVMVFGSWVIGLIFIVKCSGFWVQDLGFGIECSVFGVYRLVYSAMDGLRVSGFGLRV